MSIEVDELKTSIRTHMIVDGFATMRLLRCLLKTIDFLEDTDEIRKKSEIIQLSNITIDSAARSLMDHITDALKTQSLPLEAVEKTKNLQIILEKLKISDDIMSNNLIISTHIADILRILNKWFTKKYEPITDRLGNIL